MIELILLAIIIAQYIAGFIERKDLYRRIMCNDVRDYDRRGQPAKAHTSPHEEALKKWRHIDDDSGGDKQ